MTPKRQRCMSKFLSNSTRASRPRRQRTALMEGNSPKIPCHFFHSFITDILVDGRCQLWSTTRRCTISKIFQPRRFLQNFPHMAGGSLKSKSCTRHGEAWLAVAGDTVYLFWPARSWHPWALKLFMYVKVSLSTYWRETIKMWMHIYENENIE